MDDYSLPQLPTVTTREKPILYLPDGREVTVSTPFGFARHPNVVKRDDQK